ncbi:CAP domain-containing protein [Roseibium sp. MMSF_3544]|uniref:CAP domain-containing protein n=1 Tax=unclassified Roseibium TaxID=2629323 RepID=UPI00273F3892|nr:CAP domain-containing protein [Roseibium sp. MMSF_3544]
MINNPVNGLSASEQLILELVNKERASAGLEPLAAVSQLNAAAQKHSEWMASGRVLNHTGQGGSSPWDRMRAEGWTEYPMGENIAYNPFNQHTPISGAYVPQAIVEGMHQGWMNSSGHRANILNSDYTVLGIGDAVGGHPSDSNHPTSYATQNFAGTTKNYVTGVVFDDADNDQFYDIGEELGSTTVTIVNSSGATVATKSTDPGGGYSIALANGSYTAKFTGAGINGTIEKAFSVSGDNVKLDVKDGSEGGGTPPPIGTDGNDTIYYTNGDDFWDNGVPRDIGGAGIDTLVINPGSVFNTTGLSRYGFEKFVGAENNDYVAGNDGSVDYELKGGGGNDTLHGNSGDDTLIGGNGFDKLIGKAGDDIIKGGPGRDAVWGGAGNDTIYYGAGDYFWKGDGTPKNIGGPGTDKLIVEAGSKFITSNLSWYGFEAFQGAGKDDKVTGANANIDYWLNGGGGNDFLKGSGGTDTLIGGAGNDTLTPGGSSGGVQKLQGGAGNDTYVITSNGGRIEIVELAGNGNDKLIFKDLKRSDVEVSLDSDNDMILSWDDGASQVSINDAGDHMEQFVFQNGQVFGPDDFAFV